MAAPASDWLISFRLILWHRWTELNDIWQEARLQRPLQMLCVSGRSEKNKMAAPASDWLSHIWLFFLKLLNEIHFKLTGNKISPSSTKFVYMISGPMWKTWWSPRRPIGWDIFNFSAETAERNWKKLDRKQDHKVLFTGFVPGRS